MSIVGQLRPVMAGVDYSPPGRLAVSYADWEARRRGVDLRLVHGFVPAAPGELPPLPANDDNALVLAAQERLAEFGAQVRGDRPAGSATAVTTTVVAGSGGMTLVRESGSAGLVVVGARGQGGFGDLLVGSVATQVARHAHAPVIVVRPPVRAADGVPPSGCVLVGVDGSTPSEETLRFAFDEAGARRVGLVAVQVWSIQTLSARSAGTVWPRNLTDARTQLRAIADRVLAEELSGWSAKYPEVDVELQSVHGDEPARILLEIADEVEADLIVVGAREASGSGPVLGSVSQTLVAFARASVAVIHPNRDRE